VLGLQDKYLMASTNSGAKSLTVSDLSNWEFSFTFESYGVKVRIDINSDRILAKTKAIAKKSFLGHLEFIDNTTVDNDYRFGLNIFGGDLFEFYENGSLRGESKGEVAVLGFFTSYLRAIVAERAKPWVFIHAGVVARNGRAILIPGDSYSGKTTLVADLIRQGAEYYSDEYAVLDGQGLVHPFPRDLSIRIRGDRLEVEETPPGDLGGKVGANRVKVGLVVATRFTPQAIWKPERLTIGNGIKELIAHTISIRFNTEFGLKVLNTALEHAIILKGERGDSTEVAKTLLSFMDDNLNWS